MKHNPIITFHSRLNRKSLQVRITKQLIIFGIVSVIISCSSGKAGDKQKELESLKQEEAALKEKISKLESEVALTDTTDKTKSKLVSVTEMKPQSFSHYIEVQAKVEGDEDVVVSAQSMGTVTNIMVNAGDKVSKGQVMATVDDRSIHQNFESLKSQLDLSTTLYNKQKNLWDQKIGSEVQFLNAKTQKESLEKQVAGLQDQWDMTRIKSPINGTVDDVKIKTGQMMAPGVPAVRVVNLSSLKVKGEIAESYINYVNKGNPVKIFFPDMNTEVESKVDYSGKAINVINRTFNVEVKLNSTKEQFHPNQVAVLKIADYTSAKAMIIPVGAVMKSSDGEYIFVASVEDGKMKAKRKIIKSGKIYNGTVEVTEGILPGDKVITFGYQNLVDGDIISI
ncbi:MAG: efflux RND transporter periplasmic adaptor subunit [Bacteroidota bacterium]